MQKNNSNIIVKPLVASQNATSEMHELFSCEKLLVLADKHRELCMAVYASSIGGATIEDASRLISLLVDQAEDISMHIAMMQSLEA
jgi:hypothetical protein